MGFRVVDGERAHTCMHVVPAAIMQRDWRRQRRVWQQRVAGEWQRSGVVATCCQLHAINNDWGVVGATRRQVPSSTLPAGRLRTPPELLWCALATLTDTFSSAVICVGEEEGAMQLTKK